MSTMPKNAVVWFEIPVSNLDKAKAFYSKVTGYALKDEIMGPNKTAVFSYSGSEDMNASDAVSGHLYEGKPAAKGSGNTIHLSVGNVDEALARVVPAGGEVVSGVIPIGAGRFAYCLDPDGNSIGLFSA
jgi:predicted enzyme related to lactoylglutathione lyase